MFARVVSYVHIRVKCPNNNNNVNKRAYYEKITNVSKR